MSNKAFSSALLILLFTLSAVAVINNRPVPAVLQTNLERLPVNIAGYEATEDSFSDSVYRVLNADKNVYRHYRDRNGDQIDLYIGYYGTAKGGRTGHNPYACLPGAGAAIVDTNKMFLRQATGEKVPVNYILSRMNGTDTVMLHWYQISGKKVVCSGLEQNVERFIGRVFRNRNDGAFVRITAQVPGSRIAETTDKTRNFAEMVLRLLPNYWPVEK